MLNWRKNNLCKDCNVTLDQVVEQSWTERNTQAGWEMLLKVIVKAVEQ